MLINDILNKAPVIPVLVIDKLEHAVPLADALVAGGLSVLEVTLRTPVALQAVEAIAKNVPGAIVGVGTVTHAKEFARSKQAGAEFIVSPGLTDTLINASREIQVPFLPGVFTPSEALRARDEGFQALKLFPASQAGGTGMLKAMSGPLSDLKFCPTGGIGKDDFLDYLKLPNVLCVGGSWVTPVHAIKKNDWNTITQLAMETCQSIKKS